MAKKKDKIGSEDSDVRESEKHKFSRQEDIDTVGERYWAYCLSVLTSRIIAVTVGKSKTFYLHSDILTTESEEFLRNLTSGFKESSENAIKMEDENPELFGFFVEYLYRDRSILSREVQHYSEFVTLARLYAMGERLMAPKFQSYALWRFTESLGTYSQISEESLCDLLQIACTEITERAREDPMRSQIFWYAGTKITDLQKFSMFRQILGEVEDLGKHLCLWMNKSQPARLSAPNEAQYQKFDPESEYGLLDPLEVTPKAE